VPSILPSRFNTLVSALWSDEPYTALTVKPLGKWLTIERSIADQDGGKVFRYSLVEDMIDQNDIMSRPSFDCDCDGHPLCIGYRHDFC
jgi:hypothetical protein